MNCSTERMNLMRDWNLTKGSNSTKDWNWPNSWKPMNCLTWKLYQKKYLELLNPWFLTNCSMRMIDWKVRSMLMNSGTSNNCWTSMSYWTKRSTAHLHWRNLHWRTKVVNWMADLTRMYCLSG